MASARLRKKLVKAMVPALRPLSAPFAGRALAAVGTAGARLARGRLKSTQRALAAWQQALGTSWDLPRAASALAGNEYRWLARDLVLDQLDDRQFDRMFHVEGGEHLEVARAQGRGTILLVSHFGSQMIPAHWMLRKHHPLRLYMERPHSISKFLSSRFDDDSPLGQARLFISRRPDQAAEAASSVLRAIQVLKAGMILCLAGDVRWTGSHTATARFLGVEQSYTATWAELAAMTGATVLPAFARMASDGTYGLRFLPSYRVPADLLARRQIARPVQDFLHLVEQQIAAHPESAVEYLSWNELLHPTAPPASP